MSVVMALTAHIGAPAPPITDWIIPGLLLSVCARLGASSKDLVELCCGAVSSCSQNWSLQSVPVFPQPCLAQAAGAPQGALIAVMVSCVGTCALGRQVGAWDGPAMGLGLGGFLLRGRDTAAACPSTATDPSLCFLQCEAPAAVVPVKGSSSSYSSLPSPLQHDDHGQRGRLDLSCLP